MIDDEVRAILQSARTVAVVGASDRPERDSYRVAKYLMGHGYRVIPVNPLLPEVLGQPSYGSLAEVPVAIDVVDVFRRPEAVPPIVEEAIAVGAGVVWLQLGIEHEEAAQRARDAGLQVIMNRCMRIEHMRLIAGADLA